MLNFIKTPVIEIKFKRILGHSRSKFGERSEYGKLEPNGLQRDHPPP